MVSLPPNTLHNPRKDRSNNPRRQPQSPPARLLPVLRHGHVPATGQPPGRHAQETRSPLRPLLHRRLSLAVDDHPRLPALQAAPRPDPVRHRLLDRLRRDRALYGYRGVLLTHPLSLYPLIPSSFLKAYIPYVHFLIGCKSGIGLLHYQLHTYYT